MDRRLFCSWLSILSAMLLVACWTNGFGNCVCAATFVIQTSSDEIEHPTKQTENKISDELAAPVALQADGKRIDIGKLSSYAHAGPCFADVDGDGDNDLLVGDYPGHFWFFENTGNDEHPVYTSKGKLQAGGVDAKTPVS
jgi:hypothetical protein